ncbi:hypothetical protein [Mucilaginibacter xinganensis]|uniref:Uncharacterized protein n=1 Tax=Mucilaginibacter xinganensis TaxID=1234841 RepID=A0A223NWV7_9SPHI|nr:hypothetical protein [Mucilaginibacter xinganensis]ASU34357.1 hypothetical protein MuYL_2470 [Mucilaginibacter xinganensis]
MNSGILLTIIACCIVLIICGVCTYITITLYIEAKQENKALEDLLKRSKENEEASQYIINKRIAYLEKYKEN